MEVISRNGFGRTFGQVYLGIILVVMGVLWLLSNFDMVPQGLFSAIFSWQVMLLLIGGYLLSCRQWMAGGVVSGIALFFIVTDLLSITLPFKRVILPVLVVVLGISMIVKHFARNRQ